jgi:hypothetical protein
MATTALRTGQPSLEARYLALVGRVAAKEPEASVVAPGRRGPRRR